MPGLLEKANAVLIAQDGVFSIGGIRSRAIQLDRAGRQLAMHARPRRRGIPASR